MSNTLCLRKRASAKMPTYANGAPRFSLSRRRCDLRDDQTGPILRHGFTDARLRRGIAGLSAAIYLWSLLFAVFGHTELRLPPVPPPSSPRLVCVTRPHPTAPQEPCAACAWDQCAGHAMVTPVFCAARPPLQATDVSVGTRAFSISSPHRYSSRAPPGIPQTAV